MTAPAMVAEFDDLAGWTADAVEQLGGRHAIPAACRGSSNPAALAWLAEACDLSPGTRLLDVGAGAGGPAAWAAERFGVRPVLLEPMPTACRAAARLFGLPVITADGRRIPLRTGSVDAAWCLGVLCTVEDKAALLRELHRVLRPGASLGLMVVVAASAGTALPVPEGNHFPAQRELVSLLDATGFDLLEQSRLPDTAPLSWSRRVEQVAEVIATRHRDDRARVLADRQAERFTHLFATGQISTQLIHAVRNPTTHGGTMNDPADESAFLHALEADVEAELATARASHAEEVIDTPVTEWQYDPTDAERYEVGLRGLLGAVQAMEDVTEERNS